MTQDNEIVMFAFGVSILVWLFANRKQLSSIPRHHIPLCAYFLLVLAWFATILEGFVWKNGLNAIEHLSYALSALLMCCWAYCISFSEIEA